MTDQERTEFYANRPGLLEKLQAYDAKMTAFSFSVQDVTPAEFGPSFSGVVPAVRHQTTEEQKLRASIAEAETILRGVLSTRKRAAVLRSQRTVRAKLAALLGSSS